METFSLTMPPIYHFERTVKRLTAYEKSAFHWREGVLRRTLRAGGKPCLIEISESQEAQPSLRIRVYASLTKQERLELEGTLRHMFALDADLLSFYRQAEEDAHLAQVVKERKGLHWVLEPSLYECLIKTIISQQLNLSFAATLIQRLVALAGEEVKHKGETYPVFPSPERVAELDYEDLTARQFNRRKAEYVIDISRMVAEGSLDLEGLYQLEDEEVLERLLPLRGVGRWTAECLMLFGMGRPDLLPAADIGLRNAVRKAYNLAVQPTEEEVRVIGEKWKPWRSYATFYLWDFITTG
jgi:DNA-3-methyladenine glycosylase II